MTKDRATGIMYIGNVGSNWGDKREEVNVLTKGANYGWPFREGTIDRPDLMARPDNITGTLTDPIHEYQHTSGDGCSVIGGYVYRGSKLPSLIGKYILTDYCSKKVWALDVNTVNAQKEEFLAVEFNPVSFAEDAAGELYVAVQGWHPVYKIVPGEAGGEGSEIPMLLSETGAFSDLASLTPAAGVIPYKVIAPLWSDGAVKQRWMAIPNDGSHDQATEKILYDEQEEWTFPVGSVFVKHFELALDEAMPDVTRRLETRLLVHGDDGQFYAFTYKWNDAQTDAELLEQSLVETFTITDADGQSRQQAWYYPSRSDCFVCHTGASGRVLGPKASQLNSDLLYPVSGLIGNQLESLNHISIFEPAINIATLSALPTARNLADESATLEQRARSYLDANCASCHRPEGGPRSTIDLRFHVDMGESGIVNGDVIDDLGIEGGKVVVPGDLKKSILYQRISQLGTSIAMPPLAKNKLDDEAVSLIGNWILNMEPLPVELATFSGVFDSDVIQLSWTTASETNNAGFAVERRLKGLSGEIWGDWSDIAFVQGYGTTLETQRYSYRDQQLPLSADVAQYRLKQIDFDGAFEYHQVVTVEVPVKEHLTLFENYPDPFNPTTTIQYSLPVERHVKLTVYDMQGRVVQVLVDDVRQAGTHEVFFEAGHLASGSYLYQIESNGSTLSKQMLLVK